jgi:hypothetical protein
VIFYIQVTKEVTYESGVIVPSYMLLNGLLTTTLSVSRDLNYKIKKERLKKKIMNQDIDR